MVVPRKQRYDANHDDEPHFFTVIVSPVAQLHKLRIPKKFAKDHGKLLLPNVVFLHVPKVERNFRVELLRSKGEVWLPKGWNEFAKNYSIQIGCFLLFRYERRSHFRVIIFSKTALEIDFSQTNLNQIPELTGEFQAPRDEIEEENQRNSPLKSVKAFRSSNPNFTVKIYKRNLSYNSGPVLPGNHCRDFFKRNDGNKKVILRVKEKSWNVEYRVQKNSKLCISLNFGWQKFALNNEIQEGDVCVFEMIRRHPKTYDVHLFRVSGKKMAKPTLNDEEIGILGIRGVSRDVMEKVNVFLGTRHGFAIRMRKSYISYQRPVVHSLTKPI